MTRILTFAGSTRRDSFNRALAKAAAAMAEQAGAEVTDLELGDYPLPILSQDLEAAEGIPENATRLKKIFTEHDGLLIACPEYNSSITPLLKNTIDWVSRAAEGEAPLIAYRGKVATLLSASPGALGGLRGLVHVRSILSNIGVFVCPTQVAVSKAYEAFAEDGSLADTKLVNRVGAAVTELVQTTTRLHGN